MEELSSSSSLSSQLPISAKKWNFLQKKPSKPLPLVQSNSVFEPGASEGEVSALAENFPTYESDTKILFNNEYARWFKSASHHSTSEKTLFRDNFMAKHSLSSASYYRYLNSWTASNVAAIVEDAPHIISGARNSFWGNARNSSTRRTVKGSPPQLVLSFSAKRRRSPYQKCP
jgi:hypothetical protein